MRARGIGHATACAAARRVLIRQEQRLQVVQEPPAERRRAQDARDRARCRPLRVACVDRAARRSTSGMPVRSANSAAGTPSVSRSAFSMNSNGRSSPRNRRRFLQRRAARRLLADTARGCLQRTCAHDAIGERQLRMRAGADAEIVAEAPVVDVVPAFVAGLRVRGRFVVRVAGVVRAAASDGVLDVGRRSSSGSGGG